MTEHILEETGVEILSFDEQSMLVEARGRLKFGHYNRYNPQFPAFMIHSDSHFASISPSGAVYWAYLNELHRVGGPALVSSDELAWFQEGKLHRTDGPALIVADNREQYYVDGVLNLNQYRTNIIEV